MQLPPPSVPQNLIVTFLRDKDYEDTYSHAYPVTDAAWVPRLGEIIHLGGGRFEVAQVVHYWGQHEHNICLTVRKIEDMKTPLEYHYRMHECQT
ncbi:hypothetical protein [Verrucomicrobium sp. BvORR106]|uniref:hypothetical protein n=1 Tax=Verrucomicrobium sp. BvORR106 TaxID=1403819 RepID=UPI00056EC4A8|nr:hypothetical protein [Verrucomicrobium sp. BvORR106]